MPASAATSSHGHQPCSNEGALVPVGVTATGGRAGLAGKEVAGCCGAGVRLKSAGGAAVALAGAAGCGSGAAAARRSLRRGAGCSACPGTGLSAAEAGGCVPVVGSRLVAGGAVWGGCAAGAGAGAGVVRVPGSAKSRSCSGPTVPSRGGGAGVTTLAGAVLFCAAATAGRLSSSPVRARCWNRVTVEALAGQ